MAARNLRRRLTRPLLPVVCLSLAVGCTPPPEPKQLPPQTVTQTPEPPPPSDPPPPAPERPSTVVVVDHGGSETTPPQTLADAARAEKERRQAVGKPTVVITDKNLAEYAAKGQITTGKPMPAATPAATDPKAAAPKSAQDEDYWRKRGLEIRQRWHDAVEEGKKQQAAVDRLRTQFYAEDDPYVRDGRIKPEWDRALDKLDQARRDTESAKRDLDDFTDEGYRAGALQAWLEEGIDLEPPHTPAKKDKPNEPGEPKVIQDMAREPSTPPPA